MRIGATGQICIGGAGVARGYLNQPGLTTERFIADPFATSPDRRLYMSGDFGRWRDDGNIDYIGRKDLQVKIRGFRIELGEVEVALRTFPGVTQAVAVARSGEQGNKRLVAYVVFDGSLTEGLRRRSPEAPDQEIMGRLVQQIRDYLVRRLPLHMVPAPIVPMEQLPLTPNGKIDRHALPLPEARQYLTQGHVGAATATEATLNDIWKQALKAEWVGAQDNFFELGGDSLIGIELNKKVRDSFGIELPFMAVFEYPTVRQLARFLDELLASAEKLSV